jgi:hypothetical protein
MLFHMYAPCSINIIQHYYDIRLLSVITYDILGTAYDLVYVMCYIVFITYDIKCNNYDLMYYICRDVLGHPPMIS